MKKRSPPQRQILLRLQAVTGKSKVYLNWLAHQYVATGLAHDLSHAYSFMLGLALGPPHWEGRTTLARAKAVAKTRRQPS